MQKKQLKKKRSGFGGIAHRPPGAPFFWRECGMAATRKAGKNFNRLLVGEWTLVLDAKNIPYILIRQKGFTLLFVPPLFASRACSEICSFLKEPPLKSKVKAAKNPASIQPVFFALLALVLWHALRMGWWGGLGITPEEWLEKGSLNAGGLIGKGEWFRAVTSLTLHVDAEHLLGNCLFGGIVLVVLSLRIGALNALCLSFLSGIAGNLLAVFLRMGSDYSSVGSSTALFGAMGVLCGLAIALQDTAGWRRIFFPLAAGLSWLAFLGMEGVRVDILAHVTGLASGMIVGVFVPKIFKDALIPSRISIGLSLFCVFLMALAWRAALNAG